MQYNDKKIAAYHANPDPSSVNDTRVTEKEQRLEGEESTNNPSTSARQLTTSEVHRMFGFNFALYITDDGSW